MVTCTGHIGIHEGADGRTDVRTYGRSWRHGYKTKFSHIDGLPYFLKYGAPRARGAPLLFIIIKWGTIVRVSVVLVCDSNDSLADEP